MGLIFALLIAGHRHRSLWYSLIGCIPCGWIALYFMLEKHPPPTVLPWYNQPIRFPKRNPNFAAG